MNRLSRPSVPFPADYSICPVCSLDHRHDLPRLSAEERAVALSAHARLDPLVPHDLLTAAAEAEP